MKIARGASEPKGSIFIGGEEVGEKEFEREVLDRLIRIETILTRCPECQAEVAKHSQAIAAQNEKIEGVYRSATMTAGVISAVISFVAFIIEVMKNK